MWQRFTERARRVVFFAQEEAGSLGEKYVSTEHLLLGIVREADTVAAKILEALGVSLGQIRSEIERQVVKGDGRLEADMQLTPRAKAVIDLAYEEARQFGSNYIGTEHLLLGMIREGMGLAGRVLARLGVELEPARAELKKLHDKSPDAPKLSPPPNSASATHWQTRPGNLGVLKPSEDDGEFVPAMKVGAELWESFVTTWNARDPYGWKELIEEGAVVALTAGTKVKFLKLVSGNLALVRVLEGEREGEAVYVPWESFQLTGDDTAPWPPNSPIIGGGG